MDFKEELCGDRLYLTNIISQSLIIAARRPIGWSFFAVVKVIIGQELAELCWVENVELFAELGPRHLRGRG